MQTQVFWFFVIAAAIFLVVSAVLLIRLEFRRRAFDKQLNANGNTGKKLPQPERSFLFRQRDMIAFIAASLRTKGLLQTYASSILGLDLRFAAIFSLFIVAAAMAAALWLWQAGWPWPARLALFFASMGAIYGAADCAEDIKLQIMLRRALDPVQTGKQDKKRELADAAETDAVHLLTRIKMAALALSVLGFAVWLALRLVAMLIASMAAPGSGAKPPTTKAEREPSKTGGVAAA